MFLLCVIVLVFAGIGLLSAGRYVQDEYLLRGISTIPKVLLSTLSKHDRYRDDRQVAQNIIDSYMAVNEYRKLLVSYNQSTSNDYDFAVRDLDKVLRKHKSIARRYRSSHAYSEDKRRVNLKLGNLEDEVTAIENSTSTSLQSLKKIMKENVVDVEKNNEALTIHKENLRKCDIVRLYNHKAIPLRDLSISLMNMLDNLKGKQGMEKSKLEVLEQLRELSRVIDVSVEALPTYDSKAYVENKIKINRNFLQELKNTSYVDILQIEKDVK